MTFNLKHLALIQKARKQIGELTYYFVIDGADIKMMTTSAHV